MMHDDWVMIVSNGLFVHLNKAKKAISSSHKPSITDGLSYFFILLGIEEWKGEKELLDKKTEKGGKEVEQSRLLQTLRLGDLGATFCPLFFLLQWPMLFLIQVCHCLSISPFPGSLSISMSDPCVSP